YMTQDFDSERAQELFRDCADGDAGSGLARRGTFQDVAGFGKIVFESACEIGVARAGRGDRLMFGRIAFAGGERFLPVLPVTILELDRDRRADGDAVAHTREDMGGVGFDLHAAAASVALLAAPEFAIEERLIDLQSGGNSGQ